MEYIPDFTVFFTPHAKDCSMYSSFRNFIIINWTYFTSTIFNSGLF